MEKQKDNRNEEYLNEEFLEQENFKAEEEFLEKEKSKVEEVLEKEKSKGEEEFLEKENFKGEEFLEQENFKAKEVEEGTNHTGIEKAENRGFVAEDFSQNPTDLEEQVESEQKVNYGYLHHLKSQGWNWKKCIAAIFVYGVVQIGLIVLILAVTGLCMKLSGKVDLFWKAITEGMWDGIPYFDKIWDLVLFSMFPAGLITNAIVFRSKMGYLISTAGRVRWGWLFRCVLVLLPVMTVFIVSQTFYGAPMEVFLNGKILWKCCLVLIFTPLQCIGEEMLFRGWGLQTFGPIFPNKKVGWVVLTILLSGIFSYLHGAQSVWVMAELFLFGVLACVLIGITGGMEAGMVMHSINNVVLAIITELTQGELTFNADEIVEPTGGEWIGALITILGDLLFFFVILWAWKKYQKKKALESQDIAL